MQVKDVELYIMIAPPPTMSCLGHLFQLTWPDHLMTLSTEDVRGLVVDDLSNLNPVDQSTAVCWP